MATRNLDFDSNHPQEELDLPFSGDAPSASFRMLHERDHFVQDGKNEVMDAAGEIFFFELDISTNAYRFVHP